MERRMASTFRRFPFKRGDAHLLAFFHVSREMRISRASPRRSGEGFKLSEQLFLNLAHGDSVTRLSVPLELPIVVRQGRKETSPN